MNLRDLPTDPHLATSTHKLLERFYVPALSSGKRISWKVIAMIGVGFRSEPMSLAEMNWRPVRIHEVVLAWLRAERDRYLAQVQPRTGLSIREIGQLLDGSDLSDPEQNRSRLRLLYWMRNLFVLEIPPDTEWYEVRNLKHEHLGELLVVNHAAWTDRNDENELLRVTQPIQPTKPWTE